MNGSFVTGHAVIRVRGLGLERFLDRAAHINLGLYDVERTGYTQLIARIPAHRFKRAQREAEELGLVCEQQSRGGGISSVVRLSSRLVAIIGAAAVCLALMALSRFVWRVEITGLESLDGDVLRKELSGLGVNTGVYSRSIDCEAIKMRMRAAYPQIAYVDATVDGVVFRLEVLEGIAAPELADTSKNADIIALKDGYLTSVTALDGKAVVAPGQTVKAGQTLISGEMGGLGKPKRYVCANGSVRANVWYTGIESYVDGAEQFEPTGNYALARSVQINNNTGMMGELPAYEHYKSTVISERTYFENLFVPMTVRLIRYDELELMDVTDDVEIARRAAKKAYAKAVEQIPDDAQIVSVSYDFKTNENMISAVCAIKTEEEIGSLRYTGRPAGEEDGAEPGTEP